MEQIDGVCLAFSIVPNEFNNTNLELFIKGLVLSILNTQCPVAIVNLSSHGFLETIRLLSLMYNKNGEGSKMLEKLQIYICGQEIGEEMLFCGDKLSENASRLQRTAMSQGTMSEYWEIANSLMMRQHKNFLET